MSRRFPPSKAPRGRSLATLRPPPSGPAGVAVTDGLRERSEEDRDQDKEPPEVQPSPASESTAPRRRSSRRQRNEETSDNPRVERPAAADMAARRTLALEGDPATIPPPTLIRQGEQLSAPSSAEPIELGRLHRLLQLMDLSLGPLQRSLDRPEPVDFERAEVTLAEDYERAREIYALASGLVRELERVPEGASEVRPLAVTRLSPNEPPGRQLLTAARVAFRARERPEEAGATLDDPVEGLRVHVVERDAPVLLGAGEHHGQQADRLWWESEEERNLH